MTLDTTPPEIRILYEDADGFMIFSPKNEEAAKFWARGTEWVLSRQRTDDNRFPEQVGKFLVRFPNAGLCCLSITEAYDPFVKVDTWIQINSPDGGLLNLDELSTKDRQKIRHIYHLHVGLNGNALEQVPSQYRSRQLSQIAVTNRGAALRHVPCPLRDREMCEIAVRNDGLSLKSVPKVLRDAKLCQLAVEQNVLAMEYVPQELRTPELFDFKKIVALNGQALAHIPHGYHTPEIYDLAVKANGTALEFLPEAERTPSRCLTAVLYSPFEVRELLEDFAPPPQSPLVWVPENLRTAQLCEAAVKRNPYALKWVPKSLLNPEICTQAIITTHKYVPKDNLDDVLDEVYALIPPSISETVRPSIGLHPSLQEQAPAAQSLVGGKMLSLEERIMKILAEPIVEETPLRRLTGRIAAKLFGANPQPKAGLLPF